MPDIATIIQKGDPSQGTWCDYAMDGPDLATDGGLFSAVIISLLSDRHADADDAIPDAPQPGQQGVIADRRGWWGDSVPSQGGTDRAKPDRIGSKLWLLSRAPATQQTAAKAKKYIQDALAWLKDDGVAQVVTVQTRWAGADNLAIAILITRTGANGVPVNHAYDLVWGVTTGVLGSPDAVVLHEHLVNEAGQPIVDQDSRTIEVN